MLNGTTSDEVATALLEVRSVAAMLLDEMSYEEGPAMVELAAVSVADEAKELSVGMAYDDGAPGVVASIAVLEASVAMTDDD